MPEMARRIERLTLDQRRFASDRISADSAHASFLEQNDAAFIDAGRIERIPLRTIIRTPIALQPAEIDKRNFVLANAAAIAFFIGAYIVSGNRLPRFPFAVGKIINDCWSHQAISGDRLDRFMHLSGMYVRGRIDVAAGVFGKAEGLAVIAIMIVRDGWIDDQMGVRRPSRNTALQLRSKVHGTKIGECVPKLIDLCEGVAFLQGHGVLLLIGQLEYQHSPFSRGGRRH